MKSVLIRIKRKRTEEPPTSIFVSEDGLPKAKKKSVASLLDTMSLIDDAATPLNGGQLPLPPSSIEVAAAGGGSGNASLPGSSSVDRSHDSTPPVIPPSKRSFLFTHVGTLDAEQQKKGGLKKVPVPETLIGQVESIERIRTTTRKKREREGGNLDAAVVEDGRAAKRPILVDYFKLIDGASAKKKSLACGGVTMNGAEMSVQHVPSTDDLEHPGERPQVPARVLSPLEREMDVAVWGAFQTGKMQPVFTLIHGGGNVNFQRFLADHTTALMAASTNLNIEAVRLLLQYGAKVDARDTHGRTAIEHAHCSALVKPDALEGVLTLLKQALQKEVHDLYEAGDYVYDLYTVDRDRLLPGMSTRGVGGSSVEIEELDRDVPKVSVAHSLGTLFSDKGTGGGASSSNAAAHLLTEEGDDELMLTYDESSDDDDGGVSEDSNCEDHYTNDYPEDELNSDDDNSDQGRGSSSGMDY